MHRLVAEADQLLTQSRVEAGGETRHGGSDLRFEAEGIETYPTSFGSANRSRDQAARPTRCCHAQSRSMRCAALCILDGDVLRHAAAPRRRTSRCAAIRACIGIASVGAASPRRREPASQRAWCGGPLAASGCICARADRGGLAWRERWPRGAARSDACGHERGGRGLTGPGHRSSSPWRAALR